MRRNKKQDMYNKIRNIVGFYNMIPDCINNIISEKYCITEGKNDSFKLGFISSRVQEIYSNIFNDIEEFDAEYGDELMLGDA